jgi:HTH-type transcriptional regulator / antitoxin HigA
MMKKKTDARFEDFPRNYAALCRMWLPRPIRDAATCAKAAAWTAAATPRREEFTGDQADYFDLLGLLVEEYDAKHGTLPNFTAGDMLQRLMKERKLSAADLSNMLGSNRSLVSSVLRGHRKLMLKHVRILVRRFGISADNFLG